VKESLFILEKIRNKKKFPFSGEKYAKFFHQTSLVSSRLPQQVICHLPKSQLKQDESLINKLQLVQKLQQLMPFLPEILLCTTGNVSKLICVFFKS
jgi:hypothetical protein